MLDPKSLDQLTQRISQLLPPGAKELQQDFEKNLKALLMSTFEKLDLVTREEFDVQTEVLARTRAKLEMLETRVAHLEEKVFQAGEEKKAKRRPSRRKGEEG
ncbi:MAG: accessory factor UbiK family protein [Gammaproteobacteria bacterium]|nr:MAG: accessory factor UbiK family protein [Gammaproteobacteria bacterium]